MVPLDSDNTETREVIAAPQRTALLQAKRYADVPTQFAYFECNRALSLMANRLLFSIITEPAKGFEPLVQATFVIAKAR